MFRGFDVIKRNYYYLLLFFAALMVAQFYILNFFDGTIIASGSKNFFRGINPYLVKGFLNPPHTSILAAPTLFGVAVNAFLNALLLLLLLGGPQKGNSVFVLFSPFFIVSVGEGNIFYITSLGLILLHARLRGVARGFAWTLLTCRPQDALLVTLYDAFGALRERDWTAFATAALLTVPPFML